MRLEIYNRIPNVYDRQVFARIFLDLQNQINQLSEGRNVARYNASASAPTSGDYAVGDIVYNSTPSEAGSSPNKYILLAWQCTAVSPLTFKELRCLTGN